MTGGVLCGAVTAHLHKMCALLMWTLLGKNRNEQMSVFWVDWHYKFNTNNHLKYNVFKTQKLLAHLFFIFMVTTT